MSEQTTDIPPLVDLEPRKDCLFLFIQWRPLLLGLVLHVFPAIEIGTVQRVLDLGNPGSLGFPGTILIKINVVEPRMLEDILLTVFQHAKPLTWHFAEHFADDVDCLMLPVKDGMRFEFRRTNLAVQVELIHAVLVKRSVT
jgi:hypothetical protein